MIAARKDEKPNRQSEDRHDELHEKHNELHERFDECGRRNHPEEAEGFLVFTPPSTSRGIPFGNRKGLPLPRGLP